MWAGTLLARLISPGKIFGRLKYENKLAHQHFLPSQVFCDEFHSVNIIYWMICSCNNKEFSSLKIFSVDFSASALKCVLSCATEHLMIQ